MYSAPPQFLALFSYYVGGYGGGFPVCVTDGKPGPLLLASWIVFQETSDYWCWQTFPQQTSQQLQTSVTLNCQIAMIVMNSDCLLFTINKCSQHSQISCACGTLSQRVWFLVKVVLHLLRDQLFLWPSIEWCSLFYFARWSFAFLAFCSFSFLRPSAMKAERQQPLLLISLCKLASKKTLALSFCFSFSLWQIWKDNVASY